MTDVGRRLASLSPEKRKLLELMLKEKGVDLGRAAILPRPRPDGTAPLSFAQERLWFLDRLQPGGSAYNIPSAVRLRGRLDVDALRASMAHVVERHEALRTVFRERDEEPVQLIQPAGGMQLEEQDLSALPETEREAEARRAVAREAQRPFDLERGPLCRALLLRLAPDDHVAAFTMHHIVSDGWSMGVLIREVAAAYAAAVEGKPSPLPALDVQYADYAAWQRERLQGEELDRQLAYWVEQLGGSQPVLELPTDRSRSADRVEAGGTRITVWPASIAERLRALAQAEGATLFMVLLAAFQTLLHRYSGQEDIRVGTPIANRTRRETEGLIGFFVNTLVMRGDCAGDPTFRELIRRVRETALGAFAHQDLPFERLVDALHPERSLNHSPLFQVMFIQQNAPQEAMKLPGLVLEPVRADTGASTFDLTLSAAEVPEGLSLAVEYDAHLFDATTIERLVGHFRRLVDGILRDPDSTLSKLPLLSAPEREEVVHTWNQTDVSFPKAEWTAQQLVEAQAERVPDRLAVVWPLADLDAGELGRVTYRELNTRANRLAHHLRGLGVRPEMPVGICLERSAEMIIAALAVLKAGGAYLPIDPTYPEDRLAYMLEDSGITVLLTQAAVADTLPHNDAHLIRLDVDWPVIAEQPEENPTAVSGPGNLAYLIYTSGSTGRPKGVMIEQRSFVNQFLAWEEAYELAQATVHLQMANFAFDVFSGDFIRALGSGGTLVVVPREFLLMPAELLGLMRRERVEIAEFVPAVLRSLVQYLDETGQRLDFMKVLTCGSDAWFVGEYERFRGFCGPDTRFINSFGLTEATIDSSYFESRDVSLPRDRLVPLGRPFANTRLYVLDQHREPVPVGVAGELYVGGSGVARGYHNRPDLTAEKFVPDPFSGRPGARLYRTGDMARFLPDGTIEFLGRVDFQVKIRGFRVETGEIEAVMRKHPAVRDAVVTAVTPPSTNGAPAAQRLVAYLAADLAVDRVPLDAPCEIRPFAVGGDGEVPPIEVEALDLSYGGVRLDRLPDDWVVGQRIRVRLPLSSLPDPLELDGAIAWRSQQTAGVLFEPSPPQQTVLCRTVQHITETQGVTPTDLRRFEPRVPIRSSCTIELADGNQVEVTVENLSRAGVRLVAEPGFWAEGKPLRVRVPLADGGEELWLGGAVWWAHGAKAGVKFEASPGEQERLDRWVEAFIRTQGFSLANLRSFLQGKLPDYMVPSAFVMLDALPLTPNGKVDRKALPAPDLSQRDWTETFVAPRTPAEETLAGIWAEVLGVDRVGAEDDFFRLGGHSLLATRVVSRVRRVMGVELPLRRFFETPTLAGVASAIDASSPGAGAGPPIEPVPRDGELPLSFGQQRLWFLDQLEPGSAYNIPDAVRARGALDPAALARALNEVVRRHEVLRTNFTTGEDGRPALVIHAERAVTIARESLEHLPEAHRMDEVRRRAREEARRPFALDSDPLLRVTLLRLGEEDHVLLITMHHIVSDGWSMGVLIREVGALYAAFRRGEASPLADPALQYADVAAWQRRWLTGDVLDSQLAHWRSALGTDHPALELPWDRPPRAGSHGTAGYEPVAIPDSAAERLRTLARDEGATLFMALLAAYQVLLHRYSGQVDIRVGAPIANRNRAEVEDVIGFFVNTLVHRADFGGDPTFRQLLAQVREHALGAYAHQDLPFERLVEALAPERDLAHTPLFQAMLLMQNVPRTALRLPELELEPLEPEGGIALFDLTLALEEYEGRLVGALEFDADRFETETARRMVRHLLALVEAIVADPDRPVSTLPMLEADERARLASWNDTTADFPGDRRVHELLGDRAARSPDLAAVIGPGMTLTHAELDRRANRLANLLIAQGVGRGDVVGVLLDRNADMAVGLVGVLKCGAAYLPIDPDYPPERIAYMLEDSGARALLTEGAPAEVAPEVARLRMDDPSLAAASDRDPAVEGSPEDLAYIIYTSGSTGAPKGVEISHRSLVNHNWDVVRRFALEPEDRVLQFATISFDVAAEEIFPTWLAGAAIVLRPAGPVPGVDELEALVAAHGITVLNLPTAYWQEWTRVLRASGGAVPGSVRLVVTGGERVASDALAEWAVLTESRPVRWMNAYGPTEATITATVYEPDAEALAKAGARPVPIGRPMANVQAHVLDRGLGQVPIGVAGELHLGGVGIAVAYRGRPELTAERFVENPFGPGRLYRTGDRARFRPDGQLEFLGRVDDQLKIRGYRIEPGEVEAVLRDAPGVVEAAVVGRRDPGGRTRLVAYVVVEPEATADGASLRSHVAASLPSYMVPSSFVVLEALPLTPSGKVDRRALPAPAEEAPERTPEAPRTEVEGLLAAIWADVLGVPSVGVEDNFFELGGDSILTIQVVARARQAGIHLTPRQVFEAQTVAALATVAGTASVVRAEQGLVTGQMPLTPIQRWFVEQDFPAPHHWNQSVLLEVRERLAPEPLRAAVAAVLRHHDALRLRLARAPEGWRLEHAAPGDETPVDHVDLSDVPEARWSDAVTACCTEQQASLDLAQGPWIRVAYLDGGPDRAGRLFIAVHHLAMDGVSWRILLEDLASAYGQAARGGSPGLPPKTTAFRDWGRRLERFAETPEAGRELAFWTGMADGATGTLPRDGQGANTEESERTVQVALTEEETRALLREVPAAYRTEINDALLAGLGQALAEWAGPAPLLVDLEGHGREDVFDDVDLSRTVGWFTTVYPVRLDLAGLGPGEAIGRMKDRLRSIPRRGLGYGVLRYLASDTAGQGAFARLPEAEVSFNYLGQMDQAMAAEGPFGPAPEPAGADHDPRGPRTHVLDITGAVAGGRLTLALGYSEGLHRQESIERLGAGIARALRELIAHSRTGQAGGATPEDFPLAGLSQRALDKVLAKIGK